MKKVKIILYIVFLALVVAYSVCCFAIPDKIAIFNEIASDIMGKPIVIAGISTTLGGILIFIITKFILTNTKFGRKELDKIRNDAEDSRNQVFEYQNTINLEIEGYKNEIKEFKQDCNNQVAVVVSEFTDLQKETLAALRTIPNKKVQAIVDEYEKKFEERKVEIIEKVSNSNDYIDKKLKEMFEEFMEKLQNEREKTVNIEAEEE